MMVKDGMLLYHGSYAPVREIDPGRFTQGKDFGRGFYMTSSPEQARRFIRTSILKAKAGGVIPEDTKEGYVSVFRLHVPDELNVYCFPESSKEWLWYIALNRRKGLAKELLSLIPEEIALSDVIAGKIANDTTNPVLTAYLSGLYGEITSERAVAFAIEQLLPDHLVDQFCFLTDRAINCLEFLEARRYDEK